MPKPPVIGPKKPKNFKKSFSDMFKLFFKYKAAMWFAICFATISSVLSCLVPIFTKYLMESIRYNDGKIIGIDMANANLWGSLLVVTIILILLTSIVQEIITVQVGQDISKDLRNKLFWKIKKLPLNYLDRTPIGDSMSRLTNDVDSICVSLNQTLSTCLNAIMLFFGLLIAMFVTSWQLTIVCMISVPLGFLCLWGMFKFSQKYFDAQQKNLGKLSGKIEEIYSNNDIVNIFNAVEKETKSFVEINKKLRSDIASAQTFGGMFGPIMNFTFYLGYAGVFVVAAILMHNHTWDTQTCVAIIASFTSFIAFAQGALASLAQGINGFQPAIASAERVFEFFELKEEEDEKNKTKTIKNVKGDIEFKNVSFGYLPEKEIIHDLSIKIKAGQKIAIVGPTGAGKTTIVNLLMRFYDVNKGQILIDDIPTQDLKRENLRELFSMVLQDTWLFNGTIEENIKYTTEAKMGDVVNAAKIANIDHFIGTLPNGYKTVFTDNAIISAGEKQLLTIARAMLQDNPIVILDEATSNVDTRTELKIQDAMDKLTKGRTSFIIAHRLSTIKNADLILVMKDGEIIEKGTHQELLKGEGFYSVLYNSQFSEDV